MDDKKKVTPLKVTSSGKQQAELVMQRGGYRPGAGRKAKGIRRPVKINLPQEEWDYIEGLIENEHVESLAEYFRILHFNSRE